jgi:hypothetical protein
MPNENRTVELDDSGRVIVHTTAYMLRNTARGALIRIHALRGDQDLDWNAQEHWDSDDDGN